MVTGKLNSLKQISVAQKTSLTRESCGVFFQHPELVPEFHHGLADHRLLVVVLGLEVVERDFGCVLVGLEHRAQSGDLFPLRRQQRLELDHLLLQLLHLFTA